MAIRYCLIPCGEILSDVTFYNIVIGLPTVGIRYLDIVAYFVQCVYYFERRSLTSVYKVGTPLILFQNYKINIVRLSGCLRVVLLNIY